MSTHPPGKAPGHVDSDIAPSPPSLEGPAMSRTEPAPRSGAPKLRAGSPLRALGTRLEASPGAMVVTAEAPPRRRSAQLLAALAGKEGV